jgi:hypothetical protein
MAQRRSQPLPRALELIPSATQRACSKFCSNKKVSRRRQVMSSKNSRNPTAGTGRWLWGLPLDRAWLFKCVTRRFEG